MPSEQGRESGHRRARLAGLLLDTLAFGQPSARASQITVVALRVSDSIKELAVDILENPASVTSLIEKWQEKVKTAHVPGTRATVEDNASTIHQKKRSRGDFEARVLALYRALDGDVYEAGKRVQASVARVKRDATTSTTAPSGRIADHLDRLKRARVLLEMLEREDKMLRQKVYDGHRDNLPVAVLRDYREVEDGSQLHDRLNEAIQHIIKREQKWTTIAEGEKKWIGNNQKKSVAHR